MKKVLIIGAGFLQDFVICKAKAMGYEVYTICFLEGLINIKV